MDLRKSECISNHVIISRKRVNLEVLCQKLCVSVCVCARESEREREVGIARWVGKRMQLCGSHLFRYFVITRSKFKIDKFLNKKKTSTDCALQIIFSKKIQSLS